MPLRGIAMVSPQPPADQSESPETGSAAHLGALRRTTKGWRRRSAALLVIVLVTLTTIVFNAGPASAYARGCSFWNPFSVSGYNLAAGQYCAEVDGGGTYIYQVEGDFSSVGNICNWDITAEFFDSHWNYHTTLASSHNYGCGHTGRAYIYAPYYLSQLTGDNYGYMCSTLRVGWQRVTSVCHYIHP